MGFFASIAVGIIAGYLGSLIFKGHGLGLIGNLFVGLLGGALGFWLLKELEKNLIFGYINAIIKKHLP